jgi:hypothetical protein
MRSAGQGVAEIVDGIQRVGWGLLAILCARRSPVPHPRGMLAVVSAASHIVSVAARVGGIPRR